MMPLEIAELPHLGKMRLKQKALYLKKTHKTLK